MTSIQQIFVRARIARQPPCWLLILLLLLLASSAAAAESRRGKVSWVYDGDSIKVEGVGKVRLIGIDSPEKEDSPRDDYYLRQQRIARMTLRQVGRQALEFNLKQLKNKRVRLEFDREQTDNFGRTLAYVFLPDGRLLNRILLEKGLAAVYRRFDFKRKKEFLKAEKSARDQQQGLWHK